MFKESKNIIVMGLTIITIFLIVFGIYKYNQMREELFLLKYKTLQDQVSFLEIQNKQYQASIKTATPEEIAQLVEKKVSKKMKEILKKEKITSAGTGSAIVNPTHGSGEIVSSEFSKFKFSDINLDFSGEYNIDNKKWNFDYNIKPIPIKFNYLVTTKIKNKIPIKKVYIEAINERTNEKLAFKNIEIKTVNPFEAKDKVTFFESKTFKITFTVFSFATIYSLIK